MKPLSLFLLSFFLLQAASSSLVDKQSSKEELFARNTFEVEDPKSAWKKHKNDRVYARLRGTVSGSSKGYKQRVPFSEAVTLDLNATEIEILREELRIEVLNLEDAIETITTALDDAWLLISGVGIFTMQLGFSMLEAGTVEGKSVKSVLMKNLSDAMFGGVLWFLFGYGLAGGNHPFFGDDLDLYLPVEKHHYASFFHSYGFAVTSTTIVSGAIVGRIRFESYLLFSVIFTAYVYPMVAHWCWTANGFLGALGFVDFAGGMVAHGLGGSAALVGSYMVGSRVGRFYPLQVGQIRAIVRPLKCNSVVLTNLGGSILYINWFFFNGGSSLALVEDAAHDAASKAVMNTLLASVFAASTTILFEIFWTATKEVEKVINGLLAGLVIITAGCASVSSIDACIMGVVGGLLYLFSSHTMLHRFNIDDPLDAFSIHCVCGSTGTLLIGLFSESGGILHGHSPDLLIAQLQGVAIILSWGILNSILIFNFVRLSIGLKVSKEEQVIGLDLINHDAAIEELDAVQVQEFALRKDMENRMIQQRRKERETKEKKSIRTSATKLATKT